MTSQVAYAIAARRPPQWRSSTFWFRCTGATACEIQPAAVDDGRAKDLFNSVSGAHFASATVIDSVRVGAGRRPLDTPYLILSIQHDGRVKDLIAHLAEPKQRELLEMRFSSPKTSPRRRTCERSFRTTAEENCADCHLLPTPPPRRRPEGAHQTRTRRRSTENHRRPSTGTHGELRQARGTLPGAHARQHPEGLQHGVRARRLHVDASARASATAREWIGQLADRITTAESKPTGPTTLNLGFSYAGLVALGVGKCQLKWCSEAFEEGMSKTRRRAPRRRRLQRTRSLDPRSDPARRI